MKPKNMSPLSATVERDDARLWLAPLFHGVCPSNFSPEVFKQKFLASQLESEQLVELAIINQPIAESCLKDTQLFRILTSSLYNILAVCEAHESIALKFVSNPTLYDQFTPHPNIFFELAENFLPVCKAILNNPTLCSILSGEHITKLKNQYGITIFGEAHDLMATVDKYRAFQTLTPYFEGKLIPNFSFAQFKHTFVTAQATATHLSCIGENYLPIATASLEDPQFRVLLMEYPFALKKLGIAHESIALKIINQQRFRKTALSYPSMLHSFAKKHFSVCKALLSTPSLRNNLTPKQLYNLVVLHGYEAVVLIKNIPELHRQLEVYVLLSRGLKSPAVQEQISHMVNNEEYNGKSSYRMGEAILNLPVANRTQIAMGYFLKAACAASVNENPEGIKLALDAAQLTLGMLHTCILNQSVFRGVDSIALETASFLTNEELNTLFPALLNYTYEKQHEKVQTQLAEAYITKHRYGKKPKLTGAALEEQERQESEKILRQPRYKFARYNTALPYLMRAVMIGDDDAKSTLLKALTDIFASGMPNDEMCEILLGYWHTLNNHNCTKDNELRDIIKRINALPLQYSSIRANFINTLFSDEFIWQVDKDNNVAFNEYKKTINTKIDAILRHHQKTEAQRIRLGTAIDKIHTYGNSLQITNPELSERILSVARDLKYTLEKHFGSDTTVMADPDKKLKTDMFQAVDRALNKTLGQSLAREETFSKPKQLSFDTQVKNYLLSLLLDALVGIANTTHFTFLVPAKLTETRLMILTEEVARSSVSPIVCPAA